jgi:hypothetical protein
LRIVIGYRELVCAETNAITRPHLIRADLKQKSSRRLTATRLLLREIGLDLLQLGARRGIEIA